MICPFVFLTLKLRYKYHRPLTAYEWFSPTQSHYCTIGIHKNCSCILDVNTWRIQNMYFTKIEHLTCSCISEHTYHSDRKSLQRKVKYRIKIISTLQYTIKYTIWITLTTFKHVKESDTMFLIASLLRLQ